MKTLEAVLDSAFAPLADLAFQSLVVLGIACVFARVVLARRSAAARHAVLAGSLLVVLVLPLVWGFWPRCALVGPDADWSAAGLRLDRPGLSTLADPGVFGDPFQGEGPPPDPSRGGGVVASRHDAAPPAPGPAAKAPADGRRVAVVAWLAGAGLVAAWMLLGLVRARRLIARTTRAPDELEADVLRLAPAAGLAIVPRIRISPDLDGPVLFGWRRPVILWPETLETALDSLERSPLMLHELLHVARRDTLVLGATQLVRMLFWHNPFAWVLGSMLAREREILTDAAVVRRTGSRADYAAGLLEVLKSRSARSAVALALGVTAGSHASLRERMHLILSGPGRAWNVLARGHRFLVALGLALLAMTTLSAGVFPTGTTPAGATGLRQEEATVRIELTEPLPSPSDLADPAVATRWPEARRARAGKIFVEDAECPSGEVHERLLAFGVKNPARRDPRLPSVSTTRILLACASNRSYQDILAILNAASAPDVAITRVELVPAGTATGVERPNSARKELPRSAAERDASTSTAILAALDWLARHQGKDGAWRLEGPGAEAESTENLAPGLTGLAILTFLGAGHDLEQGKYRDTIASGIRWIAELQDAEGCFGPRTDHRFNYNQAIATMAIAEACALTRSESLKGKLEKAVAFILRCQNPYKAWRYGMRPGDNDTSVTCWMLLALKSAMAAGIEVPKNSLDTAFGFLESMTDVGNTWRTGYTKRGERPVRPEGLAARFPATETEALTAMHLAVRALCARPADRTFDTSQVDLLMKRRPDWNPERGTIDFIYWYFGTLAMFQQGGKPFDLWNDALLTAVLGHQAGDGPERGSWDPVDPWSADGGRVYSTALMAMSLEVSARSLLLRGGEKPK